MRLIDFCITQLWQAGPAALSAGVSVLVSRIASDPHDLGTPYQFENNYFTETCSGSEAGSYLRPIDFVYHSTLGLRVIKKRREGTSYKPW